MQLYYMDVENSMQELSLEETTSVVMEDQPGESMDLTSVGNVVQHSGFPKFESLPPSVQRKIWKFAMDAREPRHVYLTDGTRLCQPVPALVDVCRMARSVAFEDGRVFQLGDGRFTWFCPSKDFVYWDSFRYNLGELTSEVRNLIIPYYGPDSDRRIIRAMSDLFLGGNPSQLETIFVVVSSAIAHGDWSEQSVSRFFGDRTIIAPALTQVDSLIDVVDDKEMVLPEAARNMWRESKEINFDDSGVWSDYAGDLLLAWINLTGHFCNDISAADFPDFEKEELMHPSGTTWWDWFATHEPLIVPTMAFMNNDGARAFGF
ncbi:hypothetical protein Daesc_010051 [Daldinia eschscholtzii]|uniref:2EXR domain-containing protein n=1 Tax=Daldinia eschscholtzii TaxID=292717 RepID=A0AAX6M782_9PEZI